MYHLVTNSNNINNIENISAILFKSYDLVIEKKLKI